MTVYKIQHSQFTWMNVVRPTPADIDYLRREYAFIHPLNLEDLLSATERPKIDEEDDYLFVVMHYPAWDPILRLSRASELEFIVSRGALITVHDGSLKPLVRLFSRCELYEPERQKLLERGAGEAFYAVVDHLIDHIFPMLAKVDANLHRIEDNIFIADTRLLIEDIAVQRRDILALRRIIRHQVPILQHLERTNHPIIREEMEQYFGDALDHLYRARDIVEEDAEIISGLAETADTLISHRTNEVIRMLTVISVFILPLTLISGIYGMNVDLPLDEHPVAFIFVVGLMLTISTLMLLYFRRRKWI